MRTPRRTTIALVSGVSAVAALASCSSGAATADTADETASQPSDEPTASEDTSAQSGLTDGTYSATGTYESPAGQETVAVSLTLADGVVTAVEVTPEATNPTSKQFQTTFASGVADVVVGQPIDGLSVDAVSGSSLTPEGFNDALAQIVADAQA
ncbi:FMN-binding protein [Cellulomonas sp.]|uniref:FMN-binding protein n=1 Tax=Cellulomonas sp. TaxID=40001 RepID=UPI003BAA3728